MILKDEFEKLGINVILTRNSDEYISLSERCNIANNADADLLISIHRNSYEWDSFVGGIEAWISSSRPDKDYAISDKILTAITSIEVTSNRGIKYGTRDDSFEEDYAINRESKMPSLILEMGYMSNDTDNILFDTRLEEYCHAIAYAVADYYLNNGLK